MAHHSDNELFDKGQGGVAVDIGQHQTRYLIENGEVDAKTSLFVGGKADIKEVQAKQVALLAYGVAGVE